MLPASSRAETVESRFCVHVIDDDEGVRETFSLILTNAGFHAFTSATASAALEVMTIASTDLVFLDLRLPGTSGLECLAKLQALRNPPPVIVISGYATVVETSQAFRLGAVDVLEKPIFEQDLLVAVGRAMCRIAHPPWQSRQMVRQKGRRPSLDPRVEHVLGLVREHVAEQRPLSLPWLAATVEVTPSYLSRLVRRTTGYRVVDIIRRERALYAAKLMLRSNDELRDIALRAGYKHHAQLCRDFRRVFGCAPGDYLRRTKELTQ